jgi:hypothetical protein
MSATPTTRNRLGRQRSNFSLPVVLSSGYSDLKQRQAQILSLDVLR